MIRPLRPTPSTLHPGGRKLYQQAAATIAAAIQRGDYRPGQRIPSERELAEEHKVSRPTIREALIALEVTGLVRSRHGSGIFVVDNPPNDTLMLSLDIGAFELTEARRLFEGETAALAAVSISDEDIARLETLVADMERENQEHVSGEHADREFHVVIARATQNSAIVGVVESLWDARYSSPLCAHMLERARSVGVQPRIDEHLDILQALRERDPVAARAAMRDHLARVIEGLLQATEIDTMERTRAELEVKRTALAKRGAV
ncbi:MAG: FadR/GntR family transcriptional regulator [Sphingomonas sp.]|uniref:FadR/GntR family transcriptional regulator n=1 Tax=unclassified Sphingomonas TaxID=196159 RepID=UPI000B0C87AF|nr:MULTISPECIES: FadR/GntR family transcriptional regulator [unclassified Sphingomonas]MDR6849694.1 GntR family transcriptional repressor for pyruvate dehydrogenase complex [Sphingomonas sp. BE137]MDR7258685.1 GntR family transcriptional repressor for pyruvate dehydrogenase complex [Sphingomonas sp. BE270]